MSLRMQRGVGLAMLLMISLAWGCGEDTDDSVVEPDGSTPIDTDAAIGTDGGPTGLPDGSPGQASIIGTAAVGAPIANTPVDYICDNGASGTARTDANGDFSFRFATGSAACALRVSFDTQALYSFTPFGEGIVNVTPLTDMMTRLALDASGASADVDAWFENPVEWNLIADQWQAALRFLGERLEAAGFILPDDFDPLAATFSAMPGDPYDNLLEAIAAAIEADPDVEDYDAFARRFVGGETLPSPPASSLLPNPMGDGAALGDYSGATGTVGAETYTFADEGSDGLTSWSKIGVDSNYTFVAYASNGQGGFDPLTVWRLSGVPGQVGIHTCGDKGDYTTMLRLDRNGTNTLADACKIEIIELSPNTVKGRFTARMGDDIVTDGYFQVLPATGGGGTLGPSEEALVFSLGGTDYKYTTVSDGAFETFETVYASPTEAQSPGFPVGVQLHSIPGETGTFECDKTYNGNDYRKVNVWFYWNGVQHYAGQRQNPNPGVAGASCSITLTAVGSTVEGTFSGTFVSGDEASTVVVTNGEFRLIK